MMRTLLIIAAALVMTACGSAANKAGGDATADPAVAQNDTKMIRLNVFVTINPENVAEVIEGLNTLAAASRAEAGCNGYEIYQSTIEPTRVFIVETWANDAALAAHNESPHFTTILPPLMDGKMTLTVERFEF